MSGGIQASAAYRSYRFVQVEINPSCRLVTVGNGRNSVRPLDHVPAEEEPGEVALKVLVHLDASALAEGAHLSFRSVPARARCQECAKRFKINDLDWMCPHCQTTRSEIIEGKELYLESIEAP